MSQKYKARKLSELDDFINNHLKKGTLDKHVSQLLESFAADSVVMLLRLVNDPSTPHATRLKCIQEVLDRKLGKNSQSINISGSINHNHLLAGVIMLPETKQTPIVKLGTDMMPLLEAETTQPLQVNEEAIDAEYVEVDNDVGKIPTQTND